MPVAANTAMAVVASPYVQPPVVGLIPSVQGTPNLIDAETENAANPGMPGDASPQRWEAGFQYLPEQGSVTSGVADPCSPGTMTDVANVDKVVNIPAMIWAGFKCSAFGWEATDFKGRAERSLLAEESRQAAHEFWTGAQSASSSWGNLHLASAATTVLSSTGVDPGPALAILEDALAELSDGQPGMIHVTRQVGALLSELGNTFRALDGKIYTYMGNLIVPDVGYPGTDPTGAKPASGASYAYATLMVTVRRSPITVVPETMGEAVDRLHNVVEFRAYRAISVSVPDTVLVGVKVNAATPTGFTIGS